MKYVKNIFDSPKKKNIFSITNLIIISFSFLMVALSLIGIYYIVAFSGWIAIAITFGVLFFISFVALLALNIYEMNNIQSKEEEVK